jgi:hypothetical protein
MKGTTMHTLPRWMFIVSIILAAASLIGAPHLVPAIDPYAVYLALAGWLLLTLGFFVKTT